MNTVMMIPVLDCMNCKPTCRPCLSECMSHLVICKSNYIRKSSHNTFKNDCSQIENIKDLLINNEKIEKNHSKICDNLVDQIINYKTKKILVNKSNKDSWNYHTNNFVYIHKITINGEDKC